MPELIPILTTSKIDEKVTALAGRISSDYKDRDLVMIGVLKGAFIFLADLLRRLTIPVTVDFIQVSSYGKSAKSSGEITVLKPISVDITGKHVLLVEDIIDTGLTLNRMTDYIGSLGAATVGICAMIDKRERRECDVPVDYVGHVVEDGFLVGYGLDYAEQYRELPAIYHLKF